MHQGEIFRKTGQKEPVELRPGNLFLLEEPFGREREEMAEVIDRVIYLGASPEVSFGRRVHDLIKHDPEVHSPSE